MTVAPADLDSVEVDQTVVDSIVHDENHGLREAVSTAELNHLKNRVMELAIKVYKLEQLNSQLNSQLGAGNTNDGATE